MACFVWGEHYPRETRFPDEIECALQKAFIDHQWGITKFGFSGAPVGWNRWTYFIGYAKSEGVPTIVRQDRVVSVLQVHGLTLQMPSSVWVAVERTAWRPDRLPADPIRPLHGLGAD
jgi:hypothetical protein